MPSRPSQSSAPDEERLRLGALIRNYRTKRKMSLRSLAEAVGASPSFISQLELGHSGASLGMLRRIADALSLTMADLFDDGVEAAGPRIVTQDGRPQLPAQPGTRRFLISQRPLQEVAVYTTELEPDTATASAPHSHGDSQEVVMVLGGHVTLVLGDPGEEAHHELAKGDSTEYRSSVPHMIVNTGDETAEVLFVISPPTPI